MLYIYSYSYYNISAPPLIYLYLAFGVNKERGGQVYIDNQRRVFTIL
jgi:hypothetical protein